MEKGNQAPAQYSIFPMFWLLIWCELQLSSPFCLGFPAMMKFVLRTQISSLWLQLFSSEYYISNREINNRKRRYTQNLKPIAEGKADSATQNKKYISEWEEHHHSGSGKGKQREDIFRSFAFPSLCHGLSRSCFLLYEHTGKAEEQGRQQVGSWSLYRATKIMSTTKCALGNKT